MFHFEVALDLHAGSTFPNGSELRGIVDLAICQPRLYDHSWRSVTSVSGPRELHISQSEPEFWDHGERVEAFASPVTQPHSTNRDQRHTIRVPFLDDNWAKKFAGLAEHIVTKHIRDQKRTAHKAPEARQDAYPHTSGGCRVPSAMQLLSNIAMYQEVCPSTTCAVAQEQPEPQTPDEFASVETQALLYPCGPSHFPIFNDGSFPTGFSDTYIPDISAAMPWNNGRNSVWDWDPLLGATLGLGVPWCSGYNSEASLTRADSTGLMASYIQAQSQGQKRMSKEHDAETTMQNGMGAKRIHLVLSMP
ncbi:Uu.00g129540.m01.CDS01 [Anthostomella pinea]|uniref:Uu.00g129540.m01.CDS01 n=1 Tax=Anthostomella pinea TaxID=933095 RepID=A0AAI8VJG5_9PEZI|nr:Uu.00g129540.m01.CDS01 [Anthostomella pinea]